MLTGNGSNITTWHECDKIKHIKTVNVKLNQTIIGIKFQHRIDSPFCTQLFDSVTIEEDAIIYSIQLLIYCRFTIEIKNNQVIRCEFFEHHRKNFLYWIIDVNFQNERLNILNSRNELVIYNLSQKKIINKLFGPQRCILYSGKIIQNNEDCLVIASGTVFKTIYLWAVDKDYHLIEIQSLSGHDGVIFSIDYNQTHNVLISASDDRSIRIWTGSSDSVSGISFWKGNKFTSSHIYYGHTARIWKVSILLLYEDKNSATIFSVGEDSTIFAWSLLPPYRMIHKRAFLRNNRIWCSTFTNDGLLIGGSDSSIKFITLDDIFSQNSFNLNRYEIQVKMPKAIRFLRTKECELEMFASSINGNFHLFSNGSFHEVQLSTINAHETIGHYFKDFICMDNSSNSLVIGSKFGHLGLLSHINQNWRITYFQKHFNSKIFNVSFVADDHFICCIDGGIFNLFQVVGNEDINQLEDTQFVLPVIRHPWTSCGLLIDQILIVGDYSGNIFAFKLKDRNPFSEHRQIHGSNGVTSLRQRPNSNLVYSSGRNGKIFEYLLEKTCNYDLKLLRTFAIFPEMEWIVGFQFGLTSPFILKYVYGFESSNFRLWDLEENCIVFEEACGGGHRSWDLILCHQPNGDTMMNFAYSKKDKLQFVQRILPISKVSSLETYSSLPRKINCCSLIYETDLLSFFLIGGEDTYIQVVKVDKQNETVFLLTTLNGHISNISSIKCIPFGSENENQNTFYICSVGGRSQIMIWKLIFFSNEDLIFQQRLSNFIGLENELMNFDDRIRKCKDTFSEVDIRCLQVDASIYQNDELLILIACSDSAFRLYHYNPKENRIVDSRKISCGVACMLVAKLIPNGEDSLYCLLGSTDGNLNLWEIQNLEQKSFLQEPIFSKQIHQAGINSVDYLSLGGKFIQIRTLSFIFLFQIL